MGRPARKGCRITFIFDTAPERRKWNYYQKCALDRLGLVEMAEDPRIEQAFELIRAVLADADARATENILARIGVAPAQNRGFVSEVRGERMPGPDKRAPRGSAQMLIDKALSQAGVAGLTPLAIQAQATTEYEKMVSLSAIRNWLKEAERKKPPRYRQVGGVWYLADYAPTVRAVS